AAAVIRRPLTDHRDADRRAAAPARLAGAAVDVEVELKVAGAAVPVREIPERRAAGLDGIAEHAADRIDERREPRATDLPGRTRGMDPRAVERLVRADVALTFYDLRVHQMLLDRDLPSAAHLREIVRVEVVR